MYNLTKQIKYMALILCIFVLIVSVIILFKHHDEWSIKQIKKSLLYMILALLLLCLAQFLTNWLTLIG